MLFTFKIIISALIVAFASWLAGKKTILAGFVVALPLISILTILFIYIEHRDMSKIRQFISSLFVAIPLTLAFFIPFLLNKWLKLSFTFSFLLGIMLLFVAYFIHSAILKS